MPAGRLAANLFDGTVVLMLDGGSVGAVTICAPGAAEKTVLVPISDDETCVRDVGYHSLVVAGGVI